MFVCLPPRVDDDGAWVRILSELFILFNQLVETALVGFGRVNVFVWDAHDRFGRETLSLQELCGKNSRLYVKYIPLSVCIYIYV